MNSRLDRLESTLQSLFEDRIISILPGVKLEDRVIQKLAVALRKNVMMEEGNPSVAPNVFTLVVAPNAGPVWKEPRVLKALTEVIRQAVRDVGLRLDAQPTIIITTDASYSEKEVVVIASHHQESIEETKGMATGSESNNEKSEPIPQNAFLIVEGVKVFPLKEPVVNIGRRLENHLVIDDPRISRNHSQLRAINGRYVLFDLNSTGGSFVNGQRTSQTVLYPGDVISLAGVALIFGQDNPPPRPDLKDTSPLKDKNASDRPTATLDQSTVDIKTDRLKKEKDNDKDQ